MENEVVKTHSSGVSVYIPCFNCEAYIERCLAGVFAQTYPTEKVVVVNDGSTDNTLAILKNYAPKIELISYQPNKGLAYARNSALMRIATTYVASLDADCYAEKDWLERLMVLFSSYDVAGASGRLIGFHVERLADQWREVHIRQHWGGKRIINPPYLYGNNAVFNINVLKEVGLYDERFIRNAEDMDISKKIYKKGYKLIYEPQANVKHSAYRYYPFGY